VRRTCLASSLVYAEEFGIWGGLTASRRVPLLNALAAGARLVDVLDSVTRPRRRAA
jgi:WhiB family redox-sensing transcriptional regulator